MATGVTSQKIASVLAIDTLVHVPGSASSVPITKDSGTTKYWRPMATYELFGFGAANHTLTGNGLTNMLIVAATDSTGSNATTVLSSGTLSGTAVGNGGFIECTAAQIKEVGDAAGLVFTHVTGYATVANSADKCSVTFVRMGPKFPQSGLTPATF